MVKSGLLRLFKAATFPVRLVAAGLLLVGASGSSPLNSAETPSAGSSEKSKEKGAANSWDVTAMPGPKEHVVFTTDEGTWMNLDVSPDGKEIVFDLLGDIYVMPIEGGTAKRLLGGPAYEVQPRFSPDGKRISFTSDRDGADNVWVVKRDGSEPVQVTKEDFRLVNNAFWSPDGQYLAVKKHFTSQRSLGAGEIWLYHFSGGAGLQLTKRKNDEMDVGEPAFSPDGRYVYFSEDMSPGRTFQYNKDPHGQIYVIRRLDRETGKLIDLVTGPGGAVRPQPSPDGRYLAFVRRVRTRSVLYVRDLKTGEQWPVYGDLSKDQQETWATFGVYPNYDWTPDSRHLVFYAKGKIRRVNIESREAKEIPFEAEVDQTLTEALRFPQSIGTGLFPARMIRHVATSPDGEWVVFNAAGYLWKKRLPEGKPERLTQGSDFEFFPEFSRDGDWVVFSTWSDQDSGAICKVKLSGGTPVRLTERKGYYLTPRFSPDGSKIVFQRTTGNHLLGFNHGVEPGLYWIPADGGEPRFIQEDGRDPRFNKAGDRIFYLSGSRLEKKFKSVDLDGSDDRTHFDLKYVNGVVPSPDEEWIAFTELFHVYVAPFPKTGGSFELSGEMKAIPVKRVTRDAGYYIHWSGDSGKLHWTIGPEYFTRDLRDCFSFLEGAEEELPEPPAEGLNLGLELETDVPSGVVCFKDVRIVTMRGEEVIERGTIVVEGNRIAAVGKSAEVRVPEGAFVVDASGKTIIPGFVDVHAHLDNSSNGISPRQSWPYLANLAYGVTTAHDPSASTEMVFSQAEMVRSGVMTGPRIFSTGTILYGADGDFKAVVKSLDDARSHLRRMKAVGAFTVKSYNQPRRNQRQQILTAARELEMMVVPEGGSFFYHNMTMVVDGHTGVEHSIPIAPVYKDVLTLWGRSRVGYTPTLIVSYGGIWGENYWYQKTEVWKNERLLTFVPRALVDPRAMRRMMIPDEDFGHITNSQTCKALRDAGVRVQLGAHGQLQGLGAHWELWMLAQGGMSNAQALRAATLDGAYYLGLDAELGSIEPGKLADLIVLDKNPLEEIQNSESIAYVMANGRLYDARSMDEIGNHPRPRRRFYWEDPRYNDAFLWQGPALGFGHEKCGCAGLN